MMSMQLSGGANRDNAMFRLLIVICMHPERLLELSRAELRAEFLLNW